MSFQIGPDIFAAVDFAVFDAEGDPISEGQNRLEFVFGRGQLLPAIEQALDGLVAGDRRTVTLRPQDAYGRRDPKRILEVDRSEFPEDVKPGDRFEVENRAGAVLVLQVLDVSDDSVQLDLNHPLAGQELRVELSVVEVRPASDEELERANRDLEALEEEHQHETADAVALSVPVIPLDRLLRRPAQGYERGPAVSPRPGVHPASSFKPGDNDEH